MANVTFEYSMEWRLQAETILKHLGQLHGKEILVVNPNNYYNFKDDPPAYDSQEEIRRFDIHKLDGCTIMLVDLRNTSIGTAMEVQHAFDKSIPVIGWYTDEEHGFTHPWIECCCLKIMNGIDNACEYITNYLV